MKTASLFFLYNKIIIANIAETEFFAKEAFTYQSESVHTVIVAELSRIRPRLISVGKKQTVLIERIITLNKKLFDNYSLFFSVFGAMYDETHIRPSGAHYNYIPDALNSTDDLQFQTIEETKRAVDKQMQRFDGYNFTAYRTEVITNEALQKIYKSQNLKESSINAGLTITDDWLESASGYRFFYSMNIESYPIYRDSQILKVKTTSEGNPIICPETELFVTKDGLIYVYMKSPISDFQRSNKNVTVINASIACESIATYFENLILSSDNSVDIYKIQLEYAACRQNESIELKPVYAFYYTQGGNIGCLLVNAQNGKLL